MRLLLINLIFWSSLYGHLTIDLEEALSLAYQKNKALLVLEDLVDEAKAGKKISLSAWLPHLEAMTQGYYNAKYQTFYNAQNLFSSQLTLTQNILEMGAYYDVKISDLNVKKVELLYESLKNDITFEVKKSYYKVVYDLETLATQNEHVQLLSALLKRMKDRLKIGEAIALNVNQAQVALASQKTVYYQALKQFKNDLDDLATKIGFDPDEIKLELKTKAFDFEAFPYLKNLYSRIKSQDESFVAFSDQEILFFEQQINLFNPLLKTQQMALRMMNENVKRSYAEYYPKVQLVANYGGLPNPYIFYPSSKFTNQNFQFGMGLELTWNLFDGLKREGVIQKSRAQKMASFHELENLTQQVSLHFKESINGIQSAISQVFSSQDNVQLAELTQLQALDQFEIGYYTIYDYEIAIDQVVRVKNQLSEAKYMLFTAYFSLEKTLGYRLDEKEGKDDKR